MLLLLVKKNYGNGFNDLPVKQINKKELKANNDIFLYVSLYNTGCLLQIIIHDLQNFFTNIYPVGGYCSQSFIQCFIGYLHCFFF